MGNNKPMNPFSQLRYLQSLHMISGEKTHTYVMPFSVRTIKNIGIYVILLSPKYPYMASNVPCVMVLPRLTVNLRSHRFLKHQLEFIHYLGR